MAPPTPTPPPLAARTKERLEARDTDRNTCGYAGGTLDSALRGYSLLGCAVAAGTGQIWYTPFISSTSKRSSTTVIATTTSSSTTSSSSSSSSTTPPTPPPTPDPPSSTPIGAIVGGVVGGLGAIALIIIGIWILKRQNDKQKKKHADEAAAAAAATAAAGGGGGHPAPEPGLEHMSQLPPNNQGYYHPGTGPSGFAHLDPRASMAKPPVAYSTAGSTLYAGDQTISSAPTSPPHSPPPPGYNVHGTPSPPPQQQQGYGQPRNQQQGYDQYGNVSPGAGHPGVGYPQQQQQQQHPQHPQQGYGQQGYGAGGGAGGYAAELPAQRGDGELRELA
ncbi:hypothetical protein NEMBOFW57_005183 [Staphylotrichum longicolle]|uniref:Uncharacterized protein n=1 Tax=Staphylotrichum longicolle TaxID=669026 RepID=A0AAD4EWG3_9PEZI|nr:hypothetical protein NEMBOFW57_005183 [Staphylotrichum longicolle]